MKPGSYFDTVDARSDAVYCFDLDEGPSNELPATVTILGFGRPPECKSTRKSVTPVSSSKQYQCVIAAMPAARAAVVDKDNVEQSGAEEGH
jgi:hypothetical protein